jgi:DNA polymerase-3 subunit epsilon
MSDYTPYLVLDTETQGLPPGQMPWEIALIWRGTDVDAWMEDVIHISDYDVTLMTDQAAAINGFYDRWMRLTSDGKQIARWMTTAQAVAYLEERLAGRRIVGSNPSFDTDALINMGCNPVWNHSSRDLPSMFLGAYGYEVRGLAGVLDALGVVNEAPHTALGDACATRDAFVHILGENR